MKTLSPHLAGLSGICALLAATAPAAGEGTAFHHDLPGRLVAVSPLADGVPVIVGQPATQVLGPGNDEARFTVVATGPGPLSYQWLSNGIPVAGANGDILVITNLIAPPNLVSNGSFETPSIQGAFLNLTVGQMFDGWTVESGSIDQCHSIWWAAEGKQSVDLNGAAAGAIFQDVPTTIDQQYILGFALAGNPAGGFATKTNTVSWNGSVLDTNTFLSAGKSLTDMGWTRREYLVTATSNTTRIRFASLVTTIYGSAIDDVSLVPVLPPPVTWSVIVSNSSGSITSTVATVQFDTDHNGLPDDWERDYFGTIGELASNDNDGDGVSNADEFREGTDPTNPASLRPRLQLITTPGGAFTVSPIRSSFDLGEIIELRAHPDPGGFFFGWFGSITNTNSVVNLVMDQSKVVTGVFGRILPNGASLAGTLLEGGTNLYAFEGQAGDSYVLGIGETAQDNTSFYPGVYLYGPNGVLLKSAGGAAGGYITGSLTNSGTFLVQTRSTFPAGSGSYRLELARVPGAFVVNPGDQGGPLTNAAVHSGTLQIGDLDIWSFNANAGDNLLVSIGEISQLNGSFYPQIFLYGPNGALLGSGADAAGAYLSRRATNSGTFTVVANSFFVEGAGDYRISLAKAPGEIVVAPDDEGGTLTNGATYTGTLPVGDTDVWNFTANAGDGLVVEIGEISQLNGSFYPQIFLYGPDGALLANVTGIVGTYLSLRATNSGTFTVVANSFYIEGAGTYRLNFARAPAEIVVSPGDEGGPLTNGATHTGSLPIGDLDVWNFTANTGDTLVVEMGELSQENGSFYPNLLLYGPNGALLASYGDVAAAFVSVRATNSGTFTVVANSYYVDGAGTYRLNIARVPGAFVVSPGDEGGSLTNGGNHDGVTTIGDVDLWSFTAAAGDSIILRCADLSAGPSYYPWVRLYGPNGALLANDANNSDSLVTFRATNSGPFTVLVGSFFSGYGGDYRLRFARIPGAFIVPPGDDGGIMAAQVNYDGTIELGDEDLWTFTAYTGAALRLTAQELSGTASFTPWLRLYNNNGALVASAVHASLATLNYTPTNHGTFTLLVGSGNQGHSGTYRLSGTNISDGLKLIGPVKTGTNLFLTAAGGASNVLFVLYTSTNLAQPAPLWTPITTNRFDASGFLVITNHYNPSFREQFFRLQVP